jgi:hypothetical protein
MGVTYRANCATAVSLVSPPGTPHYNEAAFSMCGAWHYQRLNLEAALRSGLLESVPEQSRILLTNEYPMWHDTPHSIFFYAMHASKVLATIPPSARTESSRPLRKDATFAVRDVCLGKKAGYVVLSQPGGGQELRLFVRHPQLFQVGSAPTFLVVGSPMGPEKAGRYLKQGHELRILRSGSDWGLFCLQSEIGLVNPDSLSLVFDPSKAAHLIATMGPGASELARGDGPELLPWPSKSTTCRRGARR